MKSGRTLVHIKLIRKRLPKLKSEKIQDLGSYGIDVENELTSMLSEEIAKSIDIEIMKNLFKSPGRKEKSKKILDKIQQMKEKGI
jgi:hypothetical protein